MYNLKYNFLYFRLCNPKYKFFYSKLYNQNTKNYIQIILSIKYFFILNYA